jgi:hypothetical protein
MTGENMDDFAVGATARKLKALEEENETLRKKLEYALEWVKRLQQEIDNELL